MRELEIVKFMFYGCLKFSSSSALATQAVISNGMAELPILFQFWDLPIVFNTLQKSCQQWAKGGEKKSACNAITMSLLSSSPFTELTF